MRKDEWYIAIFLYYLLTIIKLKINQMLPRRRLLKFLFRKKNEHMSFSDVIDDHCFNIFMKKPLNKCLCFKET